MEDVLLESLDDGLLTLVMNRPQVRNALSPELTQRLLDAVRRAETDPAVRAILLTGAGNAFCAGGDVKAMAAGGQTDTYDQRVRHLRTRMDVSRLLHQMPKPTIALLRGAAAGAGLSLALACDIRIATPAAKLTTAFAKVGLSGDFGGTYFLPKIVGAAKARELYMLGDVLTGEQALGIGLVTRVFPDETIEEEARRIARTLASGPTVALGYIKENLNLADHGDLGSAFDAEAMRHIRCAGTDDHKEAAQAFVEKRTPVFRGR
ncbi:enoyl-CoA hydratase [Noviherbaspirillum sp.]|uniref:enoyl-CoA hydratase n=1 Tax=Noviherbaspirillum sp. TaxID=1926288 RepID=UPI002FE2234E